MALQTHGGFAAGGLSSRNNNCGDHQRRHTLSRALIINVLVQGIDPNAIDDNNPPNEFDSNGTYPGHPCLAQWRVDPLEEVALCLEQQAAHASLKWHCGVINKESVDGLFPSFTSLESIVPQGHRLVRPCAY